LWKALRPGLRPKKQGRWVPEAYADVPLDSTYVVCGFYTPDYHRWLPKLIDSLRLRGALLLRRVPKTRGGWEANTMAKPVHILAAMDRDPDRVIFGSMSTARCSTTCRHSPTRVPTWRFVCTESFAADYREIRRRSANGETPTAIAKAMGCARQTVYRTLSIAA
jgi:hypothetical protein